MDSEFATTMNSYPLGGWHPVVFVTVDNGHYRLHDDNWHYRLFKKLRQFAGIIDLRRV
jgi:hypothetical protein